MSGCCQTCGGTGGTSEGPCWDCRATGCAHPPPLCPQPGENPVDLTRLRWNAQGTWIAVEVDRHTCGTGPDGHYGAHEPGCGLEPIAEVSSGWDADAIVATHNQLLDRVTALEEGITKLADEWQAQHDRWAHLTGVPSLRVGIFKAHARRLRAVLRAEPSPGDTNPPRGTPDPPTGDTDTTTTNP